MAALQHRWQHFERWKHCDTGGSTTTQVAALVRVHLAGAISSDWTNNLYTVCMHSTVLSLGNICRMTGETGGGGGPGYRPSHVPEIADPRRS